MNNDKTNNKPTLTPEVWCNQLCMLAKYLKDPQFDSLCIKMCKDDLKNKEAKNNKKTIFEISRR